MLACFLLAGFLSSAQVRVTLTGGLNQSNVSPQLNFFADTTAQATRRTALHVGLQADFFLPYAQNLYLRTGVVYSARGAQFQQFFDTGSHRLFYNSVNLKVNYIDLPLLVVYKLPLKKGRKFMVGAGPQASLFYNGSMTVSSLDTMNDFNEDVDNDLAVGKTDGSFRTMHLMGHAMAGFEFRKMYITANYQRSLGNFYQRNEVGYKHSSLGFTLGFFIGNATPEPVIVKDRDGDGIPDQQDQCPDQAGPALYNGCPDKDGDGVSDLNDNCPDVAGTLAYLGCPIPDRDQDGLNDEVDKCPDSSGTAKYNGCPVPDTDADGINDELDPCPQEPGTENGCPLQVVDSAIIERVNFAAQQIQFNTASAELTVPSQLTLDSVASILSQNPELQLTVEGHTSLDGRADANMKLSQQRADAVKKYLVSKGLAAERITAIGYGSTRLIYNGKDRREVEKNRRVELKINY